MIKIIEAKKVKNVLLYKDYLAYHKKYGLIVLYKCSDKYWKSKIIEEKISEHDIEFISDIVIDYSNFR